MSGDEPERIDLGETPTGYSTQPGQLWVAPAEVGPMPSRLVEAFIRGEVTEGGMAEAGWRLVGRVADDGPTFSPSGLDEFHPDSSWNRETP